MNRHLLFIMLLFLFCSCASIINTSRQSVPITSNPSGATITMNKRDFGKTPANINMKRGNTDHIITLTLNGYEPYETSLARKVDAWIIGNILFGGIIGLCIDAISGGMYHLSPDRVEVTLKPKDVKTSR